MDKLKEIPGYPNYFADINGRIYSKLREKIKEISPRLRGDTKRPRINLSIDGAVKTVEVGRLVCLAWHGPPPDDKPFALHKDDDPRNNEVGNLYWGTAHRNYLDAVLHGKSEAVKVEERKRKRLTAKQKLVLELFESGEPMGLKKIAKKAGCSVSAARNTVRRYASRQLLFRIS